MSDVKLMLEYTKKLRVLYVEDDRNLVEATKELLENFFLSLDVAYNGQEGLDKYELFQKEHNEFYDLVITDINMPNINGIVMSSKIIEQNPEQSIVITSAHNEVEFLSSAIDLGIDGFVSKPIKNQKLMKVLHKVSKAIGDHKYVQEHVAVMEELTIKLETQNSELLSKNAELEKSFRMLDTMVHKEQIATVKKESNPIDSKDAQIQAIMREQIEHLITNDLVELKELHQEIDAIIMGLMKNVDRVDMYSIADIVEKFRRYASVLSFYNFFDELSSAMKNFSITLKENKLPQSKESIQNIFMILESFMYVLGRWQDDLVSGDENSINLLDASMISDMNTISNLWIQKEEEVSEEDLEGVFDF